MNYKTYTFRKTPPGPFTASGLRVIVIIALVVFILLAGRQLRAEKAKTFLISDFDYTNNTIDFTRLYRFVKSFTNRLTYSDIEVIYRHSVIFKINPVLMLARMQQESDLLFENAKGNRHTWRKYRAMGYGLYKNFRAGGKKFYVYGGYELQVYFAARTMRKLFDEYRPGVKKKILDTGETIKPENAGTYGLYRYLPFYGKHNKYGWKYEAGGNKYMLKHFRYLNGKIK